MRLHMVTQLQVKGTAKIVRVRRRSDDRLTVARGVGRSASIHDRSRIPISGHLPYRWSRFHRGRCNSPLRPRTRLLALSVTLAMRGEHGCQRCRSKTCRSRCSAKTAGVHSPITGRFEAPTDMATRSSSCRRQVQVKNSHPHGKTCIHNSKKPGSEPVVDQMPVSLVATRFHLVGEVQVENSHPHGKTCSTFWRWHQSGHGFRKLIRLLENAVPMAV